MKNMKTILPLSLLIALSTQACFVTITNDSGESVMLHDVNNPKESGREVSPGESTIFGDKTTKADFLVAQIQSCGKWKKTLRVSQTMCGLTEEEENEKKDKFVTISGILQKSLDNDMNDFFSIEDFDEAEESGMPEKKASSSCGCKKQ